MKLQRRLRLVALGGPLATLVLTSATACVFVFRGASGVGSTWGIALVMGVFVFITALLPSWLLPRRPGGGTDLEQLLAPRRIVAHWTHAAVLQGLGVGQPVSQLVTRAELDALLRDDEPIVPLTLARLIHAIETGAPARGLLTAAEAQVDAETPDWLVADLALISGCYAALIEHDEQKAKTCLETMLSTQAVPWFSDLLEASLARGTSTALSRWHAGLETFPHRTLALTANRWVLSQLVDQ